MPLYQNVGKGGGEFKGGSLLDGFAGLGGSAEHLALLSIVLQNSGPRGNGDGLEGFGGFGGHGGFGRDGLPPPKLNPPFPSS